MMTKRSIEIDLDLIAEKVAEVVAEKMGLSEKEKETFTQINLDLLKNLSSDDFQNEIVARYVGKTDELFEKFGGLIKKMIGKADKEEEK